MTLGTDLRTAALLGASRTVVRVLAVAGDHGANLLGVRPRRDPYARYERVRQHGEFYRSRLGVYLTASHGVANSILRDARFGIVRNDESSSVDWTAGVRDPDSLAHPIEHSMLSLDPPEHGRLRRVAAPWFAPRALRERAGDIERVVVECLDEIAARGETFDVLRDFAARVPVRVICELFGIWQPDYERFGRWGAVLGNTLDGTRTLREHRQEVQTVTEMGEFFDRLIAQRRQAPGDDVLSGLVTASRGGEVLNRRDIVSTAGLLLGAGFETTVNLIGNGVLALLANPESKRLLIEQPEVAAKVVDEVLRFDSPVQLTGRVATEEVTVAGMRLPERSAVVTLLGGANRDPAVFDHPHRFDPLRTNNREHLSFSAGIHYCLGAGLARVEGEIALRELFARFPNLCQAGPARRRPSRTIRGVLTLPVRTSRVSSVSA